MASFTTYIMLLFSISLALYFFGYAPPFLKMMENLNTTKPHEALLNTFVSIFTNPVFLAALGVSAIASFITGGGFGIIYLFPILMLTAFLNIFVLPTDFIFNAGMPLELRLIIMGILNLFLVLSIVEFIRGG